MSRARFAIIDPSAGVSGDMLLGALLDAGAPEDWLRGLPARLGVPDVRVEIARVRRCGIACTKVDVVLPGGVTEGPSPEVAPVAHHHHGDADHTHDHAFMERGMHQAHGGHHHLGDLLARLDAAAISAGVRQRARRAFELLCVEEGRVHGVPAEAVALHEVGAIDAIVDIVGVIEGFEQLGIERIHARPLALGQGWIRAAHGVMAVPAPVTARLVEGLEIGPNGPVAGEATTPTGAVLLRVLSSGPPPAQWRVIGSGWGAGGRDPEHYPNALRLLLVEPVQEAAEILVLGSDLDDLSPEYLDPLREALVAAGALDVQVWGTMMKKGRPGFRVEALCEPARAAGVTEAFFLHSPTAGVRRTVVERVTLPRRMMEVPLPGAGPVRVKVLDTPAGPRVKAEFEDVRVAAGRLGRPALDVAREVETAARALVAGESTGASRSLKERE